MKPTIGRIVIYTPTDEEKQSMTDSATCNAQDKLPAMVVAVWGEETVNLSVQLDGAGSLWKTSALKGDLPGQWNWPVIEA